MPTKLMLIIGFLAVFLGSCSALHTPEKSPTTISVLYNEKESTPFQEDWLILEEYAQRKNILLDVRPGDDADFDKAIIQTIESGNVPDIILKVWPATIESYAANGVLLPFSDYQEQMPHFQAYIDAHNLGDELDKLRLENGKFYILPGYQRQIQVQQWMYRKDLFDEQGLNAPQTYQQMFEALALLKEKYPDSTPITASWGGAHLLAMMGSGYDIPAGWNGYRDYDPAEDRWRFAPATENYRQLLRFLNRCYQAGILDPELFTQRYEDFNQKLEDGRAMVTVNWITSGFSSWNEKLAQNGFPDGEWAPLPVPESTMGIKALPAVDPFRKGLIVPSSVVNEAYFEDLLKFLDWAVYSEEGMTLTYWGVEGVTFENTPDGKAFLPEIKTPKNPEGSLDPTADFGLGTFFDLNENQEFEDYKKTAQVVEFLDRSLKAGETEEMDPALKLDANALEATRIIDEALNPYITEINQDFITGELSIEDDWDVYLAELEKMGVRTLEEIWNTAWEAQND